MHLLAKLYSIFRFFFKKISLSTLSVVSEDLVAVTISPAIKKTCKTVKSESRVLPVNDLPAWPVQDKHILEPSTRQAGLIHLKCTLLLCRCTLHSSTAAANHPGSFLKSRPKCSAKTDLFGGGEDADSAVTDDGLASAVSLVSPCSKITKIK